MLHCGDGTVQPNLLPPPPAWALRPPPFSVLIGRAGGALRGDWRLRERGGVGCVRGNKVSRAGWVRFRRGGGSALYGGGGGTRWAGAAAVVTRRLALPRALPPSPPQPRSPAPFPFPPPFSCLFPCPW